MTTNKEKGQQKILTDAHNDHARGLNSYAFFKVNNKATSEDLVQDTFIKTWRYLVKGGKIELMRAFLYHILNNLIVDEYRKHKAISLDALVEKGFDVVESSKEGVFDDFDAKAALLLIQRLPERYRTVMRMKYIQELSLKEISLITGQSRNTIAVQVHRGLTKLKSLYNTKE